MQYPPGLLLCRDLENDENSMKGQAPRPTEGYQHNGVGGTHLSEVTDPQGQTNVVHLDYGALVRLRLLQKSVLL